MKDFIWRLRHWLIRVLAGERGIIHNCTFADTVSLPPDQAEVVISNCTWDASNFPVLDKSVFNER